MRRCCRWSSCASPFELRRSELDAIDRGAKDLDTDPVIEAARAIAIAEDRAVFHGYPSAGIHGICEGAADAAIQSVGLRRTTRPW